MQNASALREYRDGDYRSMTTPLDIEPPDEWIASLAANRKIRGNVLDAGCGPGGTSLYLAELGYSVLGVDLSVQAIQRAKQKAATSRNLAQFAQADACKLFGFDRHFDTVVDVGCFHSLNANDRGLYAAALHRYCRPKSVVYLRAFSDRTSAHPSSLPIPALSETEIRTRFEDRGWIIKTMVEREFGLFGRKDQKPTTSCWFVEMNYA